MVERDIDSALAWLGRQLGGTVENARVQQRWRPHIFCDVVTADGRIETLLRGFRNPGYIGDETAMRYMLSREAAVLAALGGTSIPVPRFLGLNAELGWLAMERVHGEELLTAVDDADRRARIFDNYLRVIGELHDLDPADLDLPAELLPPVDDQSAIDGPLARHEMMATVTGPPGPDPLVALGRWWLAANRPAVPSGVSLMAGDIGPNQFFFDGETVTSLFDLELAELGDPYQDLGLLRLREMCYPIGNLPQHLRTYAANRRQQLDESLLQWWTVEAMLSGPLILSPVAENPRPQLLDQVSVYAYEPIYRRGLVESLAEVYGVALAEPDRPAATASWRTPLHDLLTAQLETVHGPAATDEVAAFWIASSAALSKSLTLGSEIGSALDQADCDDLGEVLGQRPASRAAGLESLATAVESDPERDLDRRLQCLFGIQVRREWILEPIQQAMGFASNSRLERL